MWIVRNVLRGTLYIDELDVKIPPKDYFDLDKLGRERVEKSEQIRLAFEEGYLQNIKRDETVASTISMADLQHKKHGGDGAISSPIERKISELQDMITKGLSLSQMECRLNTLQDEVRKSADYSKELQELMQQFKQNLLAPAQESVAPQSKNGAAPESVELLRREIQSVKDLLRSKSTPKMEKTATPAANENGFIPAGAVAAKTDEEPVEDRFEDLRQSLVGEFRDLLNQLGRQATPQFKELTEKSGAMSETELRARLAKLGEMEKQLGESNFHQLGKRTEADSGASQLADLLGDM